MSNIWRSDYTMTLVNEITGSFPNKTDEISKRVKIFNCKIYLSIIQEFLDQGSHLVKLKINFQNVSILNIQLFLLESGSRETGN